MQDMIDESKPLLIQPWNMVGYKEAPDGPLRTFDKWSFLYLISGEILLSIDGVSYLCSGHTVVIGPPKIKYKVIWYKDCVGYFGFFEEKLLKDRSIPVLRINEAKKITVPYEEEIFFDELMASYVRHSGDREQSLSFLDLFLSMLRPGSKETSDICRGFLDDIFSGAPIYCGPSFYAAKYGVSLLGLYSIVKGETGRTAEDWITAARMSMAKSYLKDPSISILEVAEKTGFEDQSYFSRFFRRNEGMTPSQYRNSVQNKS